MRKVSARKAFRSFLPESCVFVISVDKNRRPSGMIAGYNMKCSSDPYMTAAALWKKGYTHKLIQQSKQFVIAVPNKGLEKEVNFFGSHHGDKVDKFKETAIRTAKSKYVKPPLLMDATMNFECVLEKEVKAGDHIIFIGRVLASYINKRKKVLVSMKRKNNKRMFREF